MENTLVIRNADIDDINAIGFIAHQVWPQAYGNILSDDQLRYMLQQMYSPLALQQQMLRLHHFFLIAEVDLGEVGFASYGKLSDGNFKLHKLYVLPEFQRHSVGKALLDTVIDEAKLAGAATLRLNVNKHNSARVFYERNGFVIAGEEDIDIGNGYFMNDLIMEKKL